MPRYEGVMARFLARISIDTVRMALQLGRKRLDQLEGDLVVLNTAGDELELPFKRMFMLNEDAVRNEGGEFIDSVSLMWPQQVRGRTMGAMRDGTSLCDITVVLRDEVYAIALLQYGQMTGKWKLRYDENLKCAHGASGVCPSYCTVAIYQFNPPPRRQRKRRQRESILSKFKLPDLLPQRGWALS